MPILAAIPGLKGYIGIDLLVDPLGQAPPVVLEVNPRLTTSYLGYRTLATTSFAPWILGHENKPELNWYPHGVRFDTHGQTTLSR
ncbi:MAG: ATP-grasp domain-containing protein [Planctomycetaceae bacterium]